MNVMVNWVSIPSSDFDRAVSFYEDIFGIQMHRMGEGDDLMASFAALDDESANVGITADSSFAPTTDGARIYLSAEGAIEEVLGRVAAAGGEVLVEKSSIGEHGFYALLKDTEGNHIGLHSLT